MASKGFSLLEVVIAATISLILAVPALQGLGDAYRVYTDLQSEQLLLNAGRLVTAYYQELYHGESKQINRASSDLSANTSSAYNVTDATTGTFTLTRNYVGPPTTATTAFYSAPAAASIAAYDSYLIGVTVSSPSNKSASLKLALVVSAYYQNQIP